MYYYGNCDRNKEKEKSINVSPWKLFASFYQSEDDKKQYSNYWNGISFYHIPKENLFRRIYRREHNIVLKRDIYTQLFEFSIFMLNYLKIAISVLKFLSF